LARQIEAAVTVVALLTALRGIGYEEVELDPRAIARHPRSGKFTQLLLRRHTIVTIAL
jgi:hypothetical protein